MSTDTGPDDPTTYDLIALLEADHRRIERKIAEGAFGDDLAHEVATHMSAETQLLYREMRNEIPDDELVDRCLDVDRALEEAAAAVEAEDGAARERVTGAFADHVRIQEAEAFPRLREFVSEDRLAKLGGALETVIRMAPTRPHPHSPEEGASNILSEAFSGIIDQLFHKD